MVGLLEDLGPSEVVAHQVEELLHRLKLLLALPLLGANISHSQCN